jgi:hypothetical protein
MNRFVRRSAIVAVALATTLSAGAALAANTGLSADLLKSGLTSSGTVNSTLAGALKSSSFDSTTRFASIKLASPDQGDVAVMKSSLLDTGGVSNLAARESNPTVLRYALSAAGDTTTTLSESTTDCESTPVKLADVGMSLRQLNGEASLANEATSVVSAPRNSGMVGAFGGIKRLSGDDVIMPANAAAIRLALIKDGTSNTSFAALETNQFAGYQSALLGSTDASGALSNGASASQVANALRKR